MIYQNHQQIVKQYLNKATSKNEELLDAFDRMDDNLVDSDMNFSFTRISLLDITDRNSVVHGPSFKGNKEKAERLSIKRGSSIRGRNSIRKSRRSKIGDGTKLDLIGEVDEEGNNS